MMLLICIERQVYYRLTKIFLARVRFFWRISNLANMSQILEKVKILCGMMSRQALKHTRNRLLRNVAHSRGEKLKRK